MLLDQARELAEAGDTKTAIHLLDAHPNADEAMKAYEDLVHYLYWQKKNIQAVVILAQAGVERMLHESETAGESHSERRLAALRRARVMIFNLASFCWPGWNEPGISLTESEIQAGREAAKRNRELGLVLNPTPIMSAHAAWTIGAYHLTDKKYTEAVLYFEESARFALQAENEAEHLLGQAYAQLARCLESGEEGAESRKQLVEIKQRLSLAKDGPEYVRQVDTAEAVCRAGLNRRRSRA